jgi:hypothetical protein
VAGNQRVAKAHWTGVMMVGGGVWLARRCSVVEGALRWQRRPVCAPIAQRRRRADEAGANLMI